MSEFFLKIFTSNRLSSKQSGECFLNLIMKHFPDAIPERFGNNERVTNKFDDKNIARALDLWGAGSFIATRRSPKMYLMVSFWPIAAKKARHSSISFFNLAADPNTVYDFLIEACEAFDADYAFAHPLTQVELNERIEEIRERIETNPSLRVKLPEQLKRQIQDHGYVGMTQHQLAASIESTTTVQGGPELAQREFRRLIRRVEKEGFASVLSKMITEGTRIERYLPTLFWVNAFGRPYIELFGRERLLSSPITHICERSNHIILRISERLEDDVVLWNKFKAMRDRCKNHLNSDAFLDPGTGVGHHYHIPEFVFNP